MLGHFDRCVDKRGFCFVERIFKDISIAMGYKNPIEAIDAFERMMQEIELMNPTATNRSREIDILSVSVNPVRLKNNPVELDRPTIKTLYEIIIK